MNRKKNKKKAISLLKIVSFVFIGATSFILTVILLALATNYYIKTNNLVDDQDNHLDWTIKDTTYSPRYIFWQDKICGWGDCDLESQDKNKLIQKIYRKNENLNSTDCFKVVFLGDSFTTSPFSPRGYFDFFAQSLSEHYQCLEVTLLSSPGASSSQEIAKFSDEVDKIRPNLVIWQFYWNDFYENVVLSVHDLKNGELKRKMAYKHQFFLAGFLNQKIPLLKNSYLGKYLLYTTERKDILKNWQANIYDQDSVIQYNQQLIHSAIREMERFSMMYGFNYFTTLAPLECQFVYENQCPSYMKIYQNELRDILASQNNYISMEQVQRLDSFQVLGAYSGDPNYLFASEDEKNVGRKHLSERGEFYFGNILFYNFSDQVMSNTQ